ncbi:cytochrome o ubiquinol oxidase subunit IV [Pseudoxanthomonas japonensis]|uniref:Cytochrome bo(3) ubiquinol oxidase subunit 4 n=1 Tax=Pseudoxanthomonas japonensis TaxID=69284 RepID=A0ABQ6ZEI0_9GAMM|nr:cytochrome o ubiquinol oxidase subunit IV [Pseudoxanthomonas japonensis]KAF1723836.1 cytochrome o ubiquinol oxidase subunit IV [Pseudoxanthomonas japonensis]MCR6628392.1 cytochrome o ubiquinol oxidase subunit IV [Pseudoxanthomonas sp.]
MSHPSSDSHHDDDFLEDGIPHANLKEYATGFVLSVILTAIPFWLVMAKVLPTPAITTLVILAFAMVQVVVHMVYFLHMNPKSEGGWNLFALIFTAVLLVIVLSGTLWVMHNMNTNMMPGTHDMHRMQEAAQSLP